MSGLFLDCFQLSGSTCFWEWAKRILEMNHMKLISLALILLSFCFLTSCGVQKEGLVVMTDESYKANMFATNRAGIGSPDGILWRGDKLYLADEGSDALEVWSQKDGLQKLADSHLGCLSPEDLVIDADNNIFFT